MAAAIFAGVITVVLISAGLILHWYEQRHPEKPDAD